MVFEALVTPSGFLDPSLSAGPHSSWCQTLRVKKGLCLVSRAWGEAVVPLLYGEITLRRVGQLFALVRTLRENPKAYTHVIWNITLIFHIPEGYKPLVEQNLAYILVVCPNVRCLSFASAFADWLPSDPLFASGTIDNPLAVALRQAGPRITKFEYVDGEMSATKRHYVLPTQLIKTFVGICSLTLLLPPSSPNPFINSLESSADPRPVLDLPPLTLERLESLTLWHRDADNYLLAMSETWGMPRLRSIAFRSLRCGYKPNMGHYMKFFEKFGRDLRYLDFGPYKLFNIGPQTLTQRISAILNRCPSLQHLVVTDFCLSENLEALVSESTSFHIDVWLHYPTNNHLGAGNVARLLSSSDARLFRPGVRLLDRSLSHIPDLPRLLLPIPNQPQDGPPLVHRMAGFSIVETKWCIFQQSAEWNNIWDGFPETLSDTMDIYWEPYIRWDRYADPPSDWSEGTPWGTTSGTDSDACSHHFRCRYRLPSTDDDSGKSSSTDSGGEDDGDQLQYLDMSWKAEAGGEPGVPSQEEGLPQLTEEDILEIFTTQLESNKIPSQYSHYRGWN